MISKVLITGANSMLGVNAVSVFLQKGYEVRALVRRSNKFLDAFSVEIVYGDVTKYDDVLAAAQGCDAIVNIAATTDQDHTSLKYYTDINVVSTDNVCRASLATTAHRVVLVSTANTIGNGTMQHPADETFPPSRPFSDNLYARSKIIAEKCALSSGADIVIVNPTFMIGEYDTKPSSGRLIKTYHGHRVVFVPKGGKNFVAAADVAELLALAMENGQTRERYIGGGVNLSFADFCRLLAQTDNRKVTVLKIPHFVMWLTGGVGSLLRMCGIKTALSHCNTAILDTMEYYSSAKAVDELKMPQTDILTAIDKSKQWLLKNRIIKKLF